MSCPTSALHADEIKRHLQELTHWQFNQNAIERVYDGKNYLDALEKLNQIARLSEAADHHPELTLNWKRLTVRYWTHTAKGITELDFKLAQQVEALLNPEGLPDGAAEKGQGSAPSSSVWPAFFACRAVCWPTG